MSTTPALSPESLAQQITALRERSLSSLLRAQPRRLTFSLLASEKERTGRLIEATFAWAERPTEENASVVAAYYPAWSRKAGPQREYKLLEHSVNYVEQHTDGACWNIAFVPFVFSASSSMRASAALHLAVLHPLQFQDVFTGPAEVCRLASRVELPGVFRAAAMAGALQLHDFRCHCVLLDAWRSLPDNLRTEVLMIDPGALSVGLLEFVIAAMQEEKSPETYRLLAAQLMMYPEKKDEKAGYVYVERMLPSWSVPEKPFIVRRAIPFAQMRDHFAPKLRELSKRETNERVMPTVLRAWGVE